MSDRLNGQTAWEFACGWYTPEQIAHSIANRYRTPSDTAIPDDIDSVGFAQWLTEQYRLAMAKGIQIAQQDCADRLAEAEAAARILFDELSLFTRTEWLADRWPWLAEEAAKAGGCDATNK